MRVVSWNIHGGIGRDGRCDPERVLKHLHALRPDILALQFGRRAEAFEFFADALGPHCVEARLVRRPGRDYGHFLWSRWPISASGVHLLPDGRIEQRGAIEAVIATPDGSLRVLATHLGLWPASRRRQAQTLAELAEKSDVPVVALGDFNEWHPRGGVHAALSAVLPRFAMPPTWPARRPTIRLDRLYAREDLVLTLLPEGLDAAEASDHLPLVAEISFAAPEGTGSA
jgi:endonuclease/exonuclease/phosphatase family metal-dependent hydrolase